MLVLQQPPCLHNPQASQSHRPPCLLPEANEPMRNAYQKIRDKADAKGVTAGTDKVTLKFVVPTKDVGIVSLSLDVPFEATIPMAMEPGVQALGAYNAGFYTSMTFVIPEAVSSGIHSYRAAFDLHETQEQNTRETLRGCQTITTSTE